MLELLSQYWIIPIGIVILLGPKVYSYFKDSVSNIKLPSFAKGKVESVDQVGVVNKDVEAVQWLANRAVDVGDKDLILELENVNKKFFHIHCDMRKPNISNSSNEPAK